MSRTAEFIGISCGWKWMTWCVFACLLIGCVRSSPPEIPEFKPPPKPVVTEETKPVLAVEAPEPEVEEPTPEPEPEPDEPVVDEPEPEPPKPAPKPVEPEPAAPSLVGTWRVIDMSHNGQSSPEFDQMEMTFTFTEDGTVTMSVSSDMMPESMTRDGTYTLADGQITMNIEGQSQTGSYSFDGNDRVTIEIDKARMVLKRT